MEKFNYKNVNEIPKLEKVVLNIGCGEAVTNSKAIESAVADMTMIAGQKPIITKAKKSIAAFKLREGMPIGVKVTLRGSRMYEFLDKFMNIAPAPGYVTSEGSTPSPSTAVATIPSA